MKGLKKIPSLKDHFSPEMVFYIIFVLKIYAVIVKRVELF